MADEPGAKPERSTLSDSGGAEEPVAPLDRPLQDHLGKHLRSAYHVMTDKPAFLGDAVVPPQFDGLIRKLEARERERNEAIHDKAVHAVEEALDDILSQETSAR